ncbi:hypothetical protein M7I_2407 [Glarea lozoyensis 74030]|uniref:Uncharacterized protein n=1 Tax=Glarea lozoyensis (strain ATCC 74030 / MF5533) TaxID=1104152 RepID=H0EIP5_GLAL7|nr:hypothetical protein M7I_2407 [Glarea lozoyensis 74030]
MSQLQVGHINDARREERIEEMKARVAKKEAIREEERQNAFIVNEQQLDARIEEIFTEKPFFGSQGNNIWDAQGQPKSVQEMLAEINKTQKNVVDRYAGPAIITGKRMQKIAEELTGGKME